MHTRVSDFLRGQVPFSFLSDEDLLAVSGRVIVKYFPPGSVIYEETAEPGQYFYVVRQGSIRLSTGKGTEKSLIDVVDEGGVLGIRALLARQKHGETAEAPEDTLAYLIPFHHFLPFIERYGKVALYFASGFARGTTQTSRAVDEETRRLFFSSLPPFFIENEIPALKPGRELIVCPPEATLRDAARSMSRINAGSIVVVDDQNRPIGILTNGDFRKKAVAEGLSHETKVRDIMSSPVLTIPPGQNVADVLLMMMKHKIRHLCITHDGTPDTALIGIVSEHDILLIQGNNPALILKEVVNAPDKDKLPALADRADKIGRRFVVQESPVSFVSGIMSEIGDALVEKALEFARASMVIEDPGLRYAWLSLGSEGRSERLIRTDQDNALIYEDPPPEKKELARAYFLALAQKTSETLISCGYAPCKGGYMAENPRWNMPLSEWTQFLRQCIDVPVPESLLFAGIFFDFRHVSGDPSFALTLNDYLFSKVDATGTFLHLLAKDALRNTPPLGFFRSFLVERSGEHKDSFDVKIRGTMPFVDAARVLAYDLGIRPRNTVMRLQLAGEKLPSWAEICEESAAAFELLSRMRVANAFQHPEAGNHLNPRALGRLDREILRRAFQTMGRLQKALSGRYRIDLIA